MARLPCNALSDEFGRMHSDFMWRDMLDTHNSAKPTPEPLSREYIQDILQRETAFSHNFQELRAKICSSLKGATQKAFQEENALLFGGFTTESLGQFITPETSRVKVTFVGDDQILLFRFKQRQWNDFNPPTDVLLIDCATLQHKLLASDIEFYSGIKNPHLDDHLQPKLLFYKDCDNLRVHDFTQKIKKIPSCEPERSLMGFSSDNKHLLVSDFHRNNQILFFDINLLEFATNKTIEVNNTPLRTAHHAEKKYIACGFNRPKVTFVKNYARGNHVDLPVDLKGSVIKSLDFNEDGSRLLCHTLKDHLYVWNTQTLQLLLKTNIRNLCSESNPKCKFIGNNIFADPYIISETGQAHLEEALDGRHHKFSRNGQVVFKKFGQEEALYLAKPLQATAAKNDIEKLTLRQRQFVELLFAVQMAYRERLAELKKETPAHYADVRRFNTHLSKIPERVSGFSDKYIQDTWKSLAPLHGYLKKRFNVQE
jgi:hypothetical protein